MRENFSINWPVGHTAKIKHVNISYAEKKSYVKISRSTVYTCMYNHYYLFMCDVDYSVLTVPTAPPQSFTVTVLGPRSLRLSWTPPPSDQQNGEILGYTVTVANVETGREEESNTTSTSYSPSSLHPYYTYQCKVAAFTSVGLGPFSGVVSRRTRQAGKFLEFVS